MPCGRRSWEGYRGRPIRVGLGVPDAEVILGGGEDHATRPFDPVILTFTTAALGERTGLPTLAIIDHDPRAVVEHHISRG